MSEVVGPALALAASDAALVGPSRPTKILAENDLYLSMKELETQLGFLELQEDYIRDDQKNLKRELIHAKNEILRIRSVPLVIGQFLEMIDEHHGIASSTAGSNYYVRALSTLNRSEGLGKFPVNYTCNEIDLIGFIVCLLV